MESFRSMNTGALLQERYDLYIKRRDYRATNQYFLRAAANMIDIEIQQIEMILTKERGMQLQPITGLEISGDEPELGGQSELTGNEPMLRQFDDRVTNTIPCSICGDAHWTENCSYHPRW